MYELPDGAVQRYLRDPAGHLVVVNWPGITTLDRSASPELEKRNARVLQTGEALEATLYLDRGRAPAPAG